MNSRASSDPRLALGAGNVVELGENKQVLVAGERAVGGEQLGHIADHAPHVGGLADDVEPGDRAVPEVGGSRVVSILMAGGLAGAVGAQQPENSPASTERVSESTAARAPKHRLSDSVSRMAMEFHLVIVQRAGLGRESCVLVFAVSLLYHGPAGRRAFRTQNYMRALLFLSHTCRKAKPSPGWLPPSDQLDANMLSFHRPGSLAPNPWATGHETTGGHGAAQLLSAMDLYA